MKRAGRRKPVSVEDLRSSSAVDQKHPLRRGWSKQRRLRLTAVARVGRAERQLLPRAGVEFGERPMSTTTRKRTIVVGAVGLLPWRVARKRAAQTTLQRRARNKSCKRHGQGRDMAGLLSTRAMRRSRGNANVRGRVIARKVALFRPGDLMSAPSVSIRGPCKALGSSSRTGAGVTATRRPAAGVGPCCSSPCFGLFQCAESCFTPRSALRCCCSPPLRRKRSASAAAWCQPPLASRLTSPPLWRTTTARRWRVDAFPPRCASATQCWRPSTSGRRSRTGRT